MDSQSSREDQSRQGFESALALIERRGNVDSLSMKSRGLDELLGGLEPGLFYLFYSEDGGGLADRVLHGLLVEAVRDETRRAFYLVCGNYRRSRTVLDSEYLLSLIEAEGLDVSDTISRIHVVCAFSERQQMRAPALMEPVLVDGGRFRIVVAQQITKIFYGKTALRHEGPTQFTGMISRLKGLCGEEKIVLAATCRSTGRGSPIPLPEGGSFLRHAANAIVYLRKQRKGGVSAYLVKHPDRGRSGRMVQIDGEGGPLWGG
jgi:hypothetical protein